MAGIEPASERIDPRTSTSVVEFYLLQKCKNPTKLTSAQPLCLSHSTRQTAWHSGFVSPDPTIGRRSMRADEVVYRPLCFVSKAYAAKGIAA